MASQWKSQFDDSEETTDNEWKQEPQSPDHKDRSSHLASHSLHHHQSSPQTKHLKKKEAKRKRFNLLKLWYYVSFFNALQYPTNRYHLNISGIEHYRNLQDVLPHCWSEPSLGNFLRSDLEPPILQQAAFDETVIYFNRALRKKQH